MKIDEDDLQDPSSVLDELNPREATFVAELIAGNTATQAAITAGYAKSSAYNQAHRLLRRPRVAEAIAAAEAAAAYEAGVSRRQVLEGLAHEAKTAENDAARVKAWAELARILGMYKDRVEIDQTVSYYSLSLGSALDAGDDLPDLGIAEGVTGDDYDDGYGVGAGDGRLHAAAVAPFPPPVELDAVATVEHPEVVIHTGAELVAPRRGVSERERQAYLSDHGWTNW